MTPQKHTGFVAEGISKHFSQIMLCKWLADSNFGSNLFWINYTNVQQLSSSFFFSLPSSRWEKPDVGVLGAVVGSIMFEHLIINQQLCFCRRLLYVDLVAIPIVKRLSLSLWIACCLELQFLMSLSYYIWDMTDPNQCNLVCVEFFF